MRAEHGVVGDLVVEGGRGYEVLLLGDAVLALGLKDIGGVEAVVEDAGAEAEDEFRRLILFASIPQARPRRGAKSPRSEM